MGRSVALKAEKRRKSPRYQNNALPQPRSVPIADLARARRRSMSSSDESSSGAKSSQSDGPYKNLRTRKSSVFDNEDERKIPAKVLNNSTNAQNGRKRSASTISVRSAKKKTPRVTITTEMIEYQPPRTRSQRKKTSNEVTPSPASPTTSRSPSFAFNSPLPKRRLSRVTSALPEGVIDLYPSKDSFEFPPCPCGQDDCSAHALTTSFIQSYGNDYFTQLKEREEPAITPPSPMTPQNTSVSATARSRSSSSESSIESHATPEHRKDFVYIDTSQVEGIEPIESDLFLHYQPELTPKMRAILVDWIIELSEHFDFGPAALHLSVTLVDKVLARGPLSMYDIDEVDEDRLDDGESKTNCFLISRDRFQLLGAACTWLACKVEELNPPTVSEIAYVSDNIYSTEQIKRMERRICNALNFSIIHQTPYPYTYEFIRASNECCRPSCHAESSQVFHQMVMYLLEIGRLPYLPVTRKPSLLAASAVYIARVALGIKSNDKSVDPLGRWTRTLHYYTGYSRDDLKETVLAIHGYHRAAEETNLKSVFAKYKSKKHQRVALKTVPRLEDLGF